MATEVLPGEGRPRAAHPIVSARDSAPEHGFSAVWSEHRLSVWSQRQLSLKSLTVRDP